MNSNWMCHPETLKWETDHKFFSPCGLKIWPMTLKKTWHLFYATWSFVHHLVAICEFKLVTFRKLSIWVKVVDFSHPVTLKFDDWPPKTKGHLFYAASSSVHYFVTICEFRPELQSGNAKFGSKSLIFAARVTLKFDGWHREIMSHLFYATSIFVHYFVSIWKFRLELQSGNPQFLSKSSIFSARVTKKFDGWPKKTIGHFYATSSGVHQFVAICELQLKLQSRNAQIGSTFVSTSVTLTLHGHHFCQW